MQAYSQKQVQKALWSLLVIFILGILCLQAFNLVFVQIGTQLNAAEQAPLITAIPGIVLGIVCFIYGSLGDFVSLKKMTNLGIAVLVLGSIGGFLLHSNVWEVILFRSLQTAGAQVAGSVYLVLTAKYVEDHNKVVYYGIFTAGYQLSTAIGVLAAGYFTEINWSYLFLIPIISIAFIPVMSKALPEIDTKNVHIDVVGFSIFGVMIGLLTLFFTYHSWPMLLASIAALCLFIVYINNASDPFITPEFFKNKRWLQAIILMVLFYFTNYIVSPLTMGIGAAGYNLTPAQISYYLLPCYLVATVVGVSSGKIIAKLTRQKAIMVAVSCMALGFAGAGFSSHVNMLAVAACLFVAYIGIGMLFSPVVDTVLSTVPKDQAGRGVGMNDLALNVTGSIGISVFGAQMSVAVAQGNNAIWSTYSSLFVVGGAILFVGLLVFLGVKKNIYTN